MSYYINERIDGVLIDLGRLAPAAAAPTDWATASLVAKGLWAGFYLALRHPEWFAELILEGSAILDEQVNADLDWDERREWQSNVDKLVSGERPL